MADNKVNIVISATDKASGVLKGITGGIGDIAKTAAGFMIGDFLGSAIRSAARAIPDIISKASDLNETINKTAQIFGQDIAGDLTDWANEWNGQLGQSKQQMLDSAATFGIFGKAAGLTGMDLADFSTDFTELASDLASFNNTTPEEAIQAIGAALRGESEPIRRYGVLLDDASLRQEALKLGLISTTKDALTPQQRVLAAQALIYKQTSDAQGDFLKTSDGLANQQRILAAQMDNVKSTLGEALLPVISTFVSQITSFVETEGFQIFLANVVEGLKKFADWLGTNLPIAIQILSDFWTGTLQPAIQAVWNWMSTVLIPFLQNTVFPWLAENIPIALKILSDFWTGILQPAINAVWSWMSTVLIPFLQNTVYPWLQDNIPKALKFLSDTWTNVLKPAIEAIWKFLTVDMMPVWEALGELLGVTIKKAIEILTDTWNNILKPALDAIWAFVSTYIVPIFIDFSESIGGISGAVEWLVDKIKILIDWLSKIKIPDILLGKSPSPFEKSLIGITRAMRELNNVAAVTGRVFGNYQPAMAGNINNFTMNVHTNAQSSSLIRDFRMMQAMAG